MTTRSFLTPQNELTPEVLVDVLGLVSITVSKATTSTWTEIERLIAWDWAMREHLHASDNIIRRRPKPSFVRAAEIAPQHCRSKMYMCHPGQWCQCLCSGCAGAIRDGEEHAE